jgi:cyd operon protein YbgT
MWYFAWILGVVAAAAIGVINVMWYEFQDSLDRDGADDDRKPRA